jgi:hypothetical protein
MGKITVQDPSWVNTVLNWRWTWFAARLALTSAYHARLQAANAFFEHVGLIGGFVLVALVAAHHRREIAPFGSVSATPSSPVSDTPPQLKAM